MFRSLKMSWVIYNEEGNSVLPSNYAEFLCIHLKGADCVGCVRGDWSESGNLFATLSHYRVWVNEILETFDIKSEFNLGVRMGHDRIKRGSQRGKIDRLVSA